MVIPFFQKHHSTFSKFIGLQNDQKYDILILAFIMINMEQTVQENFNSEFTFPPSFFYKFKLIKSWKHFLKAVLPVKFDQITQDASSDEIHAFWKKQIQSLMQNEEKLCILVPAKIFVKSNRKLEQATYKMDMGQMANSRSTFDNYKSNSKKTNSERSISSSIYQCIIKVGMKLANQDSVNLRYVYDSMFLGNQKQLLIYKYCYAVEKYIEKYRITQMFKDYLDEFEKLAAQRHKSITKRNRALSFFKKEEVYQQNLFLMQLNPKIKDLQQKFNPYLRKILNDFTCRQKSKQISLKNINDFILEKIKPICIEQKTDIINEHNSYELDLYRDILIVKAQDPRLIAVQASTLVFDEVQYQYEYLNPQVQIVPPDDLWNVQMLSIDLQNQCYVFKIQIRKSFANNMPDGIFIRSKHGDESHQQNFELSKMCRQLTVFIYPYKQGEIAYQIYIWNKAGIICSTFSIKICNDLLKVNKQQQSFKHKQVHLIANTFQPNNYLIDTDDIEEQQIKLLKRNNQPFQVKDFYIGSSAIACDFSGNVKIWGGYMLSDEYSDMKVDDEEQIKKPKQQIMKEINGLFIRKVSCGISHYLLLSIFGKIYSSGDNVCGQLGLGKSFSQDIQVRQPVEIVNFNENNLFFTDILAHTHFSSFAITERGELYRWGLNQIQETAFPIHDRFKDIINYRLQLTNIFTHDPIKVTKKYISGRVTQIAAYAERFFVLTQCGDCYGWGDTKFLGIKLKDCNEQSIGYIVNPLKLMGNIRLISPGSNHCVVITKDGSVKGWGDISYFTNSEEGIAQIPINVTEQYGNVEDIIHLKSGQRYTSIATKRNILKIIGANSNPAYNQIEFLDSISGLRCSPDSVLGILTNIS